MNALAKKLTGFRFADSRIAQFKWGEVSFGWGFALALCKFEEHWYLHIHLIYINIFITLWRTRVEPEEMMESWGFSVPFGPSDVHFNWGNASKIVHMPWAWEWHRTSTLAPDGKSWIHELAPHTGREKIGQPALVDWFSRCDLPHWTYEAPYRYVLKSGEVQERKATISVEEREWRWRWFSGLAWPRKVQRTISIEFDGEVGERSGSWKGGCTGCGYELRPTESPLDCLRRMEAERKFN